MDLNNIKISENFKKRTYMSMLSIALFVVTYLVLIVLAVGLTIACAYAGIMLIALKPMLITIMVGLGLVSMGLLILIFLVKFIFKKHKIDRSNLIEISRDGEPKLFALIDEIVKEVKTDFPRKVYLSADVNASVFYNSSFWSMFFPIRKNLQIGVGLMNSVSTSEFRAILAHEFGHFSQRSMKVGSFVYNVNQVIFNMLYDNESYDELIHKWASVSEYFIFFISIGIKIIQGIQWILRKVYEVVNLNYMALSREMEFHADEVAANVAGSKPLITSLQRLDLADHSYNSVLNYYNSKIKDSVKTKNVFPQQQFVMSFLAHESKAVFENDLPMISSDHNSRFNKSKLNIENQWASHPATPDRVKELRRLDVPERKANNELAANIFVNRLAVEERVTENLFSAVTYSKTPEIKGIVHFIEEYTFDHRENSFNEMYNSYYNSKNPVQIDVAELKEKEFELDSKNMFSAESLDLIYSGISMENDIAAIRQIAKGGLKIKSFDYDGKKYSSSDGKHLADKLEEELGAIKEKIRKEDKRIFSYFYSKAQTQGKAQELINKYTAYSQMEKEFAGNQELYEKLIDSTNFMQFTMSFELIEKNLASVYTLELTLKKVLRKMLEEGFYSAAVEEEVKKPLRDYLAMDRKYFNDSEYNNEALSMFFVALNSFHYINFRTSFTVKKDLLEYQAQL